MTHVRHEPSGTLFAGPGGWEVEADPTSDAALIALEPRSELGEELAFRANLVLTVVDNAGLSFRDWQVGTDGLSARASRLRTMSGRVVRAACGGPGSSPELI